MKALKDNFARHRIPEEFTSDNGPQYSSAEFTHFAREWWFKHVTRSPRYPQWNGEVERAVKIVKSILKKEKDPAKALLAHRSSPLACGYSPSELLMGRRIRTSIPVFHTQLTPKWPDMKRLQATEAEPRQKQKANFDQRHRAIPLCPIDTDTPVYVKDMDVTGTVSGTAKTPRSYLIDTEKGPIRRNRSHLVPLPDHKPDLSQETKVMGGDSTAHPVRPPPSPNIASRPKRQIKPSLKVRENLGLEWTTNWGT